MTLKIISKNDPQIWNLYRKDGFVIINDLFSLEDLKKVYNELFEVFKQGLDSKKARDNFFDLLLEGHKDHLSMWRACASKLWDCPSVNNLYSSSAVTDLLKRLNLVAPVFSTRPEVRIDMPADNQYRQDSHQDFPYGQSSLNSVTIWTPLHDVNASNGTIQVIPGSHFEGFKQVEVLMNPRRFQIKDIIDEQKYVNVEIPFGYTVIFSQFTIHRSGLNTSGKPRLSFQGRFADLADPHFKNKQYFLPSKDNTEIRNYPSLQEIQTFFSN